MSLRTRCLLLRWRCSRWREALAMWVAWRLPRWLVYWASIRLIAAATQDEPHREEQVPELTAMDALQRWQR